MSLNVLSLTGKNWDPYVLRNDVVSVLESVPDENPLALSCHEAAANIADDRQYEQIDELTMMAVAITTNVSTNVFIETPGDGHGMNSGELVKNKRSPKWPAIFLIKGRGGYKPTRNKDRYKPNKNKRPEYLAARLRGGWLFGPEISARRSIVQSDPNHPDLPLRVSSK